MGLSERDFYAHDATYIEQFLIPIVAFGLSDELERRTGLEACAPIGGGRMWAVPRVGDTVAFAMGFGADEHGSDLSLQHWEFLLTEMENRLKGSGADDAPHIHGVVTEVRWDYSIDEVPYVVVQVEPGGEHAELRIKTACEIHMEWWEANKEKINKEETNAAG